MPRAFSVVFFALLAAACSGDPKIREDAPEHLVEDLARALRVAAVEWLDEENAVDAGPAGMGAVASQDVSAGVIRFQRFLEHGRALCDRWLPAEVRRLQTPSAWSPDLRRFAVSLALAEPDEIAAIADAPPVSASAARRVTLRLGDEEWTIRLRPVKKSWVFDSGLRRVP
jgi:hypothetical protein